MDFRSCTKQSKVKNIMTKVNVDLQNCYGIKRLNHDFDFSNGNTIAIYAPNGVMKTSFAKTFLQLQNGKNPEEKLYDLESSWTFKVNEDLISSNIKEIDKNWQNQIFVIEPFGDFESDKLSDLLIDSGIKEKLNEIFIDKQSFLKELEKLSGLKVEKLSLG